MYGMRRKVDLPIFEERSVLRNLIFCMDHNSSSYRIVYYLHPNEHSSRTARRRNNCENPLTFGTVMGKSLVSRGVDVPLVQNNGCKGVFTAAEMK